MNVAATVLRFAAVKLINAGACLHRYRQIRLLREWRCLECGSQLPAPSANDVIRYPIHMKCYRCRHLGSFDAYVNLHARD
jgi:hypothetical protein